MAFRFIEPAEAVDSGKINLAVSILPQQYFVEKIAGDLANVMVAVPKGANPDTYEPRPRQMIDLTRAELYFSIGVPFESVWLNKFQASNPEMKIVDSTRGIEKTAMAAHHGHDHSGHPGDEPPGMIKDPHVWTSPPLVKKIARNIYSALSEVRPEHEAMFRENFRKFEKEIDSLDGYLQGLFSPDYQNRAFMVFHPAWGYFAQTYHLRQIPIELEGKTPKSSELKEVIAEAKALGIRVIFVQPQFSVKSAEAIAEAIDGRVVEADPLAYEWEKNLRQQGDVFKSALK